MTFDTQRGRMILFGGVDAQGQLLVDTWEWNGSDWQAGPSGPTVAVGSLPTLAFDRSRARTVFFGGGDRNADTWEYDGTSWSLVSRLFPPNQQDAHLVYDPNSERILLISIGISGVSVWIWDGVNWASTSPSTRPPTTAWLAVHDSARERTLLQQVTWSSYGATWEWDGTTWAQTNAFDNFAYRSASAIAYDEWAGHIVTYGGLANFTSPLLALPYASEYYTDAPARYDSFGIGCAGAALPTLNSLGLPWNGAAFTAVVENLPPTSLAVLHTGFSDSSYGGISLPFSLASMGWPGCAALVGPEVVVPLTAVAGSASVAFTIPTNAALIGLQFFQQALALQVQSGSLAVTAGRAGTIGVR
jgi:hypothetical protein